MPQLETTPEGNLLMNIFNNFGGSKIALDGYNNLMINGLREYFQRRNSTPINLGEQYQLIITNVDFNRPKKLTSGPYATINRNEFTPMSARAEQASYEVPLYVRFSLFNRKNKKTYRVYVPPGTGKAPTELVLYEITRSTDVHPNPEFTEFTLYLGQMPVMVGSKLDHYRTGPECDLFDISGYFIVRGSEKYFNNVERLRSNQPIAYYDKTGLVGNYTSQFQISVTSRIQLVNDMPAIRFSNSSTKSFFDYRVPLLILKSLADGTVTWDPSDDNIRLMILDIVSFGYNAEDIKMVYNYLYGGSNVTPQVEPFFKDFKHNMFAGNYQENARKFTHQDVIVNASGILPLNALGPLYDIKYRTMCDFVYRYTLTLLSGRVPDDRDSWCNKRLNTAGMMLENKLYSFLDNILDRAAANTKNFDYNKNSQLNTSTTTLPTSVFNGLFQTDLLSRQFSDVLSKALAFDPNVSVVEPLKVDNYVLRYSMINRIIVPLNPKGYDTSIRQIHPSQFNVICPANTPEGQQNCGLIKSITVGCYVSVQKTAEVQRRICKAITTHPGFRNQRHSRTTIERTIQGDDLPEDSMYAVSLNGCQLGYMSRLDLQGIVDRLKVNRQLFDVSAPFLVQDRECAFNTSGGRLTTFYLTKNPVTNHLRIDEYENGWNLSPIQLIELGLLVNLDVQEYMQEDICLATSVDTFYDNPEKFTHSFVDPQSINSLPANTVPYMNHGPASRISYHCNMCKQAISGDALCVHLRYDTTSRVLRNPRIAQVQVDMEENTGLQTFPNGISALVAFNVSPDSQEDAILFNQDSLDNGIADLTIFHSYKEVFKKSAKDITKQLIFPENQSANEAYTKLHRTGPHEGLVQVGAQVNSGDVLLNIQRVSRQVASDSVGVIGSEKRVTVDNQHKTVDINQSGIVDAVNVEEADGNVIIQIRIRDDRSLEVGDKLCSRYAQKGVIGECPPAKEIFTLKNKFTEFKPDIMYNSHGIPSRMTIGLLIEPQTGNLAAYRQNRVNASAFRRTDMKLVQALNELYGMDGSSEFDAYSPDGKHLGKITCGIVYYQILRHLVKYKNQSRGTGRVDIITRQPLGGIRKRGGLKVGEMETHAFVAVGGQNLMEDRLITHSDQTTFIICLTCGSLANNKMFVGDEGGIKCSNKSCPGTSFNRIKLPYTWKVLTFYLAAIGLKTELRPMNGSEDMPLDYGYEDYEIPAKPETSSDEESASDVEMSASDTDDDEYMSDLYAETSTDEESEEEEFEEDDM